LVDCECIAFFMTLAMTFGDDLNLLYHGSFQAFPIAVRSRLYCETGL
jgi:hypothetical protein